MLTVDHDEAEWGEYYDRLQKGHSRNNRLGRSECSPLRLVIAKGARPRKSASHVNHIISSLCRQPDWDILYLDEEESLESADIWETINLDGGKINVSLKSEDFLPEDRSYLIRRREEGERMKEERRNEGADLRKDRMKVAHIDHCLFSRSRRSRRKQGKKISFWWFIVAVIITFLLCFFSHRGRRKKNYKE